MFSMKGLELSTFERSKVAKIFWDYGKFAKNLVFKLKSFKWKAERFFYA
jgi:hypothetical protein